MTKKVLLVDDSSTMLMMEQAILRQVPNYEVLLARDGQEAVEKAVNEKPDLILMDVVMPRMTGFEACQQLRQQETTRTIPVILVTTRGEQDNVELGYISGCSDYLTKPVNERELLTIVRNYLGE
jgi:DNA-binding response OmpR family regulator